MAEELDMHRCIALFETYLGKKLTYSFIQKDITCHSTKF